MSNYLDRKQQELVDLTTKIVSLESFIFSNDKYKTLAEPVQKLLKEQLSAMHKYHTAVAELIAYDKGTKEVMS
jgi:TRAP-type C4-dicarboxylate transport system substrate-binding protein